MRYFFCADTHFGHGNIIKYANRPFLSEEDQIALEKNGGSWHQGAWKGKGSSPWRISQKAIQLMDDTLIDNINKTVGKDDVLWHLGDFALPGKYNYVESWERYRSRIKCKNVNIVWGNHDKRYYRPQLARLFNEAHKLEEIYVDGQYIVMCHTAFAVWERSHRGAWNLYGHSHTSAEPWMDQHMPGRRSLDVGVDNAYRFLGEYRPFSFEELRDIFKNRSGFSMDHHIPTNSTAPEED